MKSRSPLWHPNTQMSEWTSFPEIVSAKGMWLYDSKGGKMLDGVASMWCNVWGHSKSELVSEIIKQTKILQHTPLFNLTHPSAEKLSKKLLQFNPKMKSVFFSDNGSTAMEIAIKIALQYWRNIGENKKTNVATLENGYHGDTFGAMSVGYVPEFFSKFRSKLFSTTQFPVPRTVIVGSNTKKSSKEYAEYCLSKIEDKLEKDNSIAAFVMESGAQMAGGVIIYPKNFQKRISQICKKNDVLFVLDEIATGFGRLGSMIEYQSQNSTPDIVSFGKMLTGGYQTFAATLTTKKINDSFLGEFSQFKHLFHGHTYTGNPTAAALSLKNLELYKKYHLIEKIQKTSKIFKDRLDDISNLDLVGEIRHQGMVMGIELVQNKNSNKPLSSNISINKLVFEEGRKHQIYFRTLGNIIMLVPPLDISQKDLNFLIDGTISTIKSLSRKL
ncbi:MAG: adenosylmethionine-8-amino-7-oxononanoate aminotransferase [Candidatus Nitrosopelagicus sp.]|jgi:adenosylmethionine-8-amino-7-oxononanoate aminotransferase|nr:adenosylmethionine--8-amino-7-oxononanoate transaminase [Candidatus Nitrosopelagicus sp.]GIT56337.1 MAG: adenosylmethionine-8-amino-7-oxononanoate aminotransferase [Candidatus Nitrosopelagicus sp.]